MNHLHWGFKGTHYFSIGRRTRYVMWYRACITTKRGGGSFTLRETKGNNLRPIARRVKSTSFALNLTEVFQSLITTDNRVRRNFSKHGARGHHICSGGPFIPCLHLRLRGWNWPAEKLGQGHLPSRRRWRLASSRTTGFDLAPRRKCFARLDRWTWVRLWTIMQQ